MEDLAKRQSSRDFAPDLLSVQLLSNLLWATYGMNRADGGRTSLLALNVQETDIFVALPSGAYCYNAATHELHLVASSDLRRITGYQDFVDEAPLDLMYVADHSRMSLVPGGHVSPMRLLLQALLLRTYTCFLPQTVGYPKTIP